MTGSIDDYTSNTSTLGSVSVGGSHSGTIESYNDQDWYEVFLTVGDTYLIDLEGSQTTDGTLSDPYLRGLYDSAGTLVSGTTNDDGGTGYNSQLEYTATATGTHYISAGAFGYATGSYTLSVTSLNSTSNDDFSADTSTHGSVAVEGSSQGTIEESYDQDWYAVTLTAGHSYQIDLQGGSTSAGTLSDTYLRGIYDSQGNLISGTENDDSGTGYNSQVELTAYSTGTYYVAAGAFGSNTGTYTVSVTDLGGDSDDFSADTNSQGTVAVDGSHTGTIEESGDQDWFAVSLTSGNTYQIDLEGSPTNQGTLSDTYLRGIYDSTGSLVFGTSNDDAGTGANSQLEYTASSTGTYYIAAGAFGSGTGTYRLSVTGVGSSDDYSDDTSTSGSLSAGSHTFGEIEDSYDQDWFAVSLVAGHEYQIDLEGGSSSAGTLPDTYLRGIHDSSGNLISGTTNDDGGTGYNSAVSYTAPSSGTYYIAASAYGSGTGTYRLSLSDMGSSDDFADTTSTHGTLTVGGHQTGEIEESSDQDWFAVTLTAGHTYQVDLEGSPSSMGTLSDTYLHGVYDSTGSLISGTTNDDGGTGYNSQIEITASSSGVYYVSAGSYGSNTGTYAVSVDDLGGVGGDDYSSDTSTTGSISDGQTASGEIEESYDQDWFSVSLSGGQTYMIDLKGSPTSSGSLGDTYLRGIYDAHGNQISGTTNDDSGTGTNSQLEFTPATSGTYYISAGAFGNGVGTYALSVESLGSQDDYSDSSAGAGSVSVNGSVTGEVETAGDNDWFSISLVAGHSYNLELEGSPTNAGTLPDTYLNGIYNASGQLIPSTSNDDSGTGTNSSVEFLADSSGTYYISAGAYGSNTGTYKLTVTDEGSVSTDDYSSSTTGAGTISVDGFQTGTIEESSDQDWFAASLEAGHTYQIYLKGTDTSNGTLSDPYFRGIYNSSGTAISGTTNDDSGQGHNSFVEFTPDSSGTYYLSAGAYGNGTGTYKLTLDDTTVTTGSSDDYGEAAQTAGSATLEITKQGNIETAGDNDWFAITLTAGSTYEINLEGSPTNNGDLADTFLNGIYNSAGTLISGTTDDDSGYNTNSSLTFTPASTGVYYVSAGAFGSGVGSYSLTVSEASTGTGSSPSPTGSFDIEINYNGDAEYQSLFDSAAARWESIIIADIPDYQSSAYGLIDDLKIDATVENIDGHGGILGQAGADELRSGSLLPSHGVMMFDSSDLASMAEKGILEDVILHEMGHVLGFSGYFFNRLGLTTNSTYNGENAVAAYAAIVGGNPTGIQLETQGGSGTAGSHWDEEIFNIELMTGYAENNPPMPISTITIGALEDIGYTVDYSQADNYSSTSISNTLIASSVLSTDNNSQQSSIMSSAQASPGGASFYFYEEKPLSITPDTTAEKLDGTVLIASETAISFIDSDSSYRVQLVGDFVKDDPSATDDIKGTVSSITFSNGPEIVSAVEFGDALAVSDVLNNWYGALLAGENTISISTIAAQNDTINPGGGNDNVDAGLGLDTVVYGDNFAIFSATSTEGVFSITSLTDGSVDTLTNVERLTFSDNNLALDLDGNAGLVARILGAVFSPSSVQNKEYAGIGLSYLDGGMSYEDLMSLALTAAGATTHESVVNLLYTNLVGVAPTEAVAAEYVALLDNGAYTMGGIGVFAADLDLNAQNIDLTGLSQSGLEFV